MIRRWLYRETHGLLPAGRDVAATGNEAPP